MDQSLPADAIEEDQTKGIGQPVSEQQLRLMVDSISDYAVFMLERDGRVASWNTGAERIKGYRAEEILGRDFSILFTPEDVATGKPARVLEKASAEGRFEEESWRARKDGSRFWANVVLSAIRDPSSKNLLGFVKVTRDLTERKLADEKLRQAQDEVRRHAENLEKMRAERIERLQKTVAILEAFSYSLSHDMRTPLRIIHSFSEVLLEDEAENLTAEGKQVLGKIMRITRRLEGLVQDALSFAGISGAEIRLENVDIDKLIRKLIEESPEYQAPNAEIAIQFPLPPVRGHEALLTHCVTNLLSNAVKFVAPETTPRIVIRAEQVADQIRIWFEDNGIGIPEEGRQGIFELFHRMHPDKSYPGTGIGLGIVRKAVEGMHGTVGVESQPGQGSRFWLQLPRGT